MKKILSIVLVVSMVLSLCIVSVSASGETNTLAYLFEDFEVAKVNNTLVNAPIVNSGNAARGKVAMVTQTKGAVFESPIYRNGAPFTVDLATGDKVKVSMKLKLGQAMPSNARIALIDYTGNLVSGAVKVISNATAANDWTTITTTITPASTGTAGPFYYRMYANNASTDSELTSYTYYIDDFEMQLIKADSTKKTQTNIYKKTMFYNDFSVNSDGVEVTATEGITGAVSNGILTYTDASTTASSQLKITPATKLSADNMYVLEIRQRVRDAKKEDGAAYDNTASLNSRIRFNGNLFRILMGERTGGNPVYNNGDWVTTKYVIDVTSANANAATAVASNYFTYDWLSMIYGTNGHTPGDTFKLDIDYIEIYTYESVVNGDFNISGVVSTMDDDNAKSYGSNEVDLAVEGNYPGWTTDDETNKMNVNADGVATMTFTSYGSEYLGETLVTAGKTYSLSGKIGANSDVDYGMVYTTATGESSVRLGTVTAGEMTAVNSLAFTVPEDVTAAAMYIMPKSDDENAQAPEGGIVVTTDDWMLVTPAANGMPYVEATKAEMAADGAVTVDSVFGAYTYGSTTVSDLSVYRLSADGVYYGTFADKNVIVVPEAARSVENLMLEIIPASSAGYIGTTVTVPVTVAATPAIEGISIEKTAGGITVSTDTDLTAAQLIFITYDGNGKMLAADCSTKVTLSAQNTQEYPVHAGFETAKVILWSSVFAPLANVIE